MNVFVLGTGRCGTVSFIKACQHITNYTSAHESQSRILGQNRLEYPSNHIEADNRLSWFLGGLGKKFNENTVYVHLTRDRDAVARSYNRRWKNYFSIIKAYTEGIQMRDLKKMDEKQKLMASYSYVDAVTDNIRYFLDNVDAPNMHIRLEDIKQDYAAFWSFIGAEGNLEKALAEFDEKHNPSGYRKKTTLVGKAKRLYRELFHK